MSKKKAHAEEHENHERWLLTYADMITLLMVLFIVLFAISTVNPKKFTAFGAGLASAFHHPVPVQSSASGSGILSGSQSALNSAMASQLNLIKLPFSSAVATPTEVQRLTAAQKEIQAALAKAHMSSAVQFANTPQGLVLTIVTDHVLFGSGQAVLEPQGQVILGAVAPALDRLPNAVSVQGYTDSEPIHTALYASNWDLSGARAGAVLSFLLSQGLPPDRASFTGFGDTDPLAPNTTAAGRARNRRVEILVVAAPTSSSSAGGG